MHSNRFPPRGLFLGEQRGMVINREQKRMCYRRSTHFSPLGIYFAPRQKMSAVSKDPLSPSDLIKDAFSGPGPFALIKMRMLFIFHFFTRFGNLHANAACFMAARRVFRMFYCRAAPPDPRRATPDPGVVKDDAVSCRWCGRGWNAIEMWSDNLRSL